MDCLRSSCIIWKQTNIDKILLKLQADLDGETHKYKGPLLTAREIRIMNNSCVNGHRVHLGDIIRFILLASKMGERTEVITEEKAKKLNHICAGCEIDCLGDFLLDMQNKVNYYADADRR